VPWSGIELAPDDHAMVSLFDSAVSALTRGLTFASQRHDVLAQNLANVETPGYRARDLVRDDASDMAVAAGAPQPLPRVTYSADDIQGIGGNDVDLERQMGRIAENTLLQHTLVQLLSSQFASLKQVISGRV
jgi:flagellar basal-body rod protein FlgB